MSTIQTGSAPVARLAMPRKNRSTLIVFFALAYGLSWAVWGSTLAQARGLIDWAVPAQPFGFLAVTVAAIVATSFFGGREALRALGTRLVLWRVPVQWYVAAVALPALPAAAALGIHLAFGGARRAFRPPKKAVATTAATLTARNPNGSVGTAQSISPRCWAKAEPHTAQDKP